MRANETYFFRFNEFEGVLKSSWQELQKDNFCDMTLAYEDRQIKSHKFVISAFSPVLRSILKLHQNPHPLIYLRKIKYINLQNLITFMYQGEVDVAEEDLPSFFEAAEDLNIRGLSEANTEGLNLSREFNSEPSHQDITPPPKRKRMVENQQKVKDIDDNPSKNSKLENFINSDDRHSFDTPKEIVMEDDASSTLNIVSKISDKKFHCQKCDKSFSSPGALYNHNNSSHEGVKYSCTECRYKASFKRDLKQHFASVHEGIKYPCIECNFKATTNKSLQQHVAVVHEGIRPFGCNQCEYIAAQKSNLRAHFKTKHSVTK